MNNFKIEKPMYVTRSLRFPEQLWTELAEVAQKQDISTNALIVQCITYALSHIAPEND